MTGLPSDPYVRRANGREKGLIGAAGLGALLLFLLTRESLTDDAYITLAYAKNLALHLHWGLIPQETANTATSPLTVAVLAALSTVTRIGGGIHPVLALGVLFVGAAMVAAWGWTRTVRALGLPWAAAAIGVALALLNPFLLSAVGLEVVFVPALLVLLLVMALEGRPVGFGLVAAAMLLTRLDLVVFVVLVGLVSPTIRPAWRRALLVTFAGAAPWFLASWLILGSAIPDTLMIKVDQGGSLGAFDYLRVPIRFLEHGPWAMATAVAFAPAVIGLGALAAWLAARPARPDRIRLAPVAGIGLGGIAYYAVYCTISVPAYHWYFVAPIAALSLVGVVLGAELLRAWSGREGRSIVAFAPLATLAALALGAAVTDVRHGVPWRFPAISGNYASAHDYARVGLALRKRIGAPGVASAGEIGTLAYFCECPILDDFSDRGRAVERVNEHLDDGTAASRLLFAINYLWLDRDQVRRKPAFQLVYGRGPAAGPDSWNVWSDFQGAGHLELVPRRPAQ